MSTPSLSAPHRGAGALAALAVAGAALLGAPAAVAAPGDNGDVKVHDANTAFDNQRDDPKVCRFYLDGFNFDAGQRITWSIAHQPGAAGDPVLAGTLSASQTGRAATRIFILPDGQYKLTWNFQGENGAGKSKVFKVDCPVSAPTPTPTPTRGGGPSATPSQPGGGRVRHRASRAVRAGRAVAPADSRAARVPTEDLRRVAADSLTSGTSRQWPVRRPRVSSLPGSRVPAAAPTRQWRRVDDGGPGTGRAPTA